MSQDQRNGGVSSVPSQIPASLDWKISLPLRGPPVSCHVREREGNRNGYQTKLLHKAKMDTKKDPKFDTCKTSYEIQRFARSLFFSCPPKTNRTPQSLFAMVWTESL